MNKEELREEFEKETGIEYHEVVNGDIPNGSLMYALWLEYKLTTKQESELIEFVLKQRAYNWIDYEDKMEIEKLLTQFRNHQNTNKDE